ncbi:MAG: hypothetical protein QXI22_07110 [Sulfolobales archaeon]
MGYVRVRALVESIDKTYVRELDFLVDTGFFILLFLHILQRISGSGSTQGQS